MATVRTMTVPEQSRSWARRAAGRLTRPVRRKAWDYSVMLRHGRPRVVLVYGNGFGDHLMCTTVFRELRKRGGKGLWMMSNHPALFEGNSDVDTVVPMDWRYPDLAQRYGGVSIMPDYARIIEEEDRSVPPTRHILSVMCAHAGIKGEIALRPYLYLAESEKRAGRLAEGQIAIQSSIKSATLPILNKEWYPERFGEVVSALKGKYQFVQVGGKNDPALDGAMDLRGKTSLRETAAILSQSLCFVGLVGFLMHLARAVDCRAVIVYGGREAPWQSGYRANENLYTELHCSPCWFWSKCDYGHECMKRIEAGQVVEAVEKQIGRHGTEMAVETDRL